MHMKMNKIPFFYLFALLSFMGTYAVYPVIDRYMIRPYEDAAEAVDPDGDL
jgi:hypothetical protein